MAGEAYIPRVFGGTLVIRPSPTLGAVTTVLSDKPVTIAQLTDQPRATALLSEKVV